MLLTITTTHRPATDLGYLLHKHSERFQSFDLSFGKAHVYYPEVSSERCTASLPRELLKDKQFEGIVGLDVSIRTLEAAQRRLKVERLPTMQANWLKLIHGSLM
jgi:hypothetical protein